MTNSALPGLDHAGVFFPSSDSLGGYVQRIVAEPGDTAFVIGEGADPRDPGLFAHSLIRHYVSATSARDLLHPKWLACDLNDLIGSCPEIRSPVTCFYAHYMSGTQLLRYFNAGHRSPLLIRRNPEDVVRLHKGGPALGSGRATDYAEGSIQMKSGDRLVAFTRAVAGNWATEEDLDAEASLIRIVRARLNEPTEKIAQAILAGDRNACVFILAPTFDGRNRARR